MSHHGLFAPGLFPEAASYCYVITEKAPSRPSLENYLNLHPLEQGLVSHAVAKRKAEFGDARWCAHTALADLGGPADPILRGERGMPLWPAGYTGSITHTDGLRAAVAVARSRAVSVGLDAEPNEALGDDVLGAIARPGELSRLERLRAAGVANPDRLLFCAQEATYKAWFPLTRRFLEFDQAEIDLRADGTFISYLLVRPTPVALIEGRWVEAAGYVVATTAVRRVVSRRYLHR